MIAHNIRYRGTGRVTMAAFTPASGSGRRTVHAVVEPEFDGPATTRQQFATVRDLISELLHEAARPVYARVMLSDVANQQQLIPMLGLDCPLSVVQQPPFEGLKICVLLFLELPAAPDAELQHLFTGDVSPALPPEEGTELILCDYCAELQRHGCTLNDNCVRTWFFVNDIDNNYAGMVRGRNTAFARHGLTASSHFIASTGIAGRVADHRAAVTFNAYSIRGLRPAEQVSYLHALTHLNPTIEYGVAFERGTAVDFADRRLCIISGTASIDNRGEILHPGDVKAQCERMLDNIEALLAEGGASMTDMLHAVVYLRDPADAAVVKKLIRSRWFKLPMALVHAPVCRPGWLIEMECMTMTDRSNPSLPNY